MTRNDLIEKVNTLLAEEFEVEKSTIQPDAVIKTTLSLSSLELVDFVAVIDYEFGIKIPMVDLLELRTFVQLYDYLESKMNEQK